jgi:hypothetical protein
MTNEGANCSNCVHQDTRPKKQCRQCVTRDGRPGWDPAPGVKTRLIEVYETLTRRRYLVRKVVLD